MSQERARAVCRDGARRDCAYPLAEALLSTLWDRGLLVERSATHVRLSNNAHRDDHKYLRQVLERAGLYISTNRLIRPEGLATRLVEDKLREKWSSAEEVEGALLPILCPYRHAGSENMGSAYESWASFCERSHGPKVAVEYLDPDLAALVKALNAIGAATSYCCAGFNCHARDPEVSFASPWDRAWALAAMRTSGSRARWRRIKQDGLKLIVDGPEQVLRVSLPLARRLYANRVTLRGLRQRLASGSVEPSEREFLEAATRLLAEARARRHEKSEPLGEQGPLLDRLDALAWTES